MANKYGLDGRVYVRELKEYFQFKQLTGDEKSLDRWIIAPDINRPGIELAGFTFENDLKRVVIIGNKESAYLKTLDTKTQKERFNLITDAYTPCMIVTDNNTVPKLLIKIANERNFPIFQTSDQTYRVITDVIAFLSKNLAVSKAINGVMMSIFGTGVLLTGPSAIGKSELALELISRGHNLISDDRVDIARIHNDLFCTAPDTLKRLLEIRGIGIVDIAKLYGSAGVLDSSILDMVIALEPYDPERTYDRLGGETDTFELFGIKIPLLKIPVRAGRAMSVIVEAAVMNHRLHQKGFNARKDFEERILNSIRNKGE